MFLKSIEIRGFKSFADKTDLSFKKGITAVVGPNGSGKSNISDAIRWVLGEQSVKSLRGGKMEDVIFAGTQYRKPVGLAQVALTLDNSLKELPIDYTDVTVSRRLYRSGESEYFINNTSCRLKDIHELFMDTGIGKEGYSIIGQGKIDAILSGRPEERRALLEEAAGIVKFKSRKEEAEKKLGNTEQNLIRINDILTTYEERLGPLEIENRKAKEFLKLSSTLNELETSLIINSMEELEEKIGKYKSKYESIIFEVKNLTEEKNKYKDELQDLEKALEDHNIKNDQERDDFYKNKEKIQDLTSKINLLEERCSNLKQNVANHHKEDTNLKNKIGLLQQEKAKDEEELIAHQNEQSKLENVIKSLEEKITNLNEEIKSAEDEIADLRENEIEILRKISEIRNNKALIENDLKILISKKEQLKESNHNYTNSLKINTTTVVMLKKEIEKLNLNIADYEEKIKENKKTMSKLNSEILNIEAKIKENNIKFNKLEANYNMLLNLENQYEGYNKSVKNLMVHLKEGKINIAQNKCRILGEIIKVPKELEVAIEISLGGSISDIITEDESAAKTLIEYLKRNNLGRATFLPLNIIKSKKISVNSSIKEIKGYIGIASELLEYHHRFSNAIEYVLGRTLICEDMDSALIVAKSLNYSAKIVTLQGEVINPGGALTGGSVYHKNVSIISRKREIEEIAKEIKNTEATLNEISSLVRIKRDNFKILDEECLNLKDEIHYQNIEITKIESKISSVENESEKLNKNILVSEKEIEIIHKKIEDNKNTIETIEKELAELSEKEVWNKDRIKKLEISLQDKNELAKSEKDRLLEVKVNKAQTDEFVMNEIKNLVRISKEIDEINEKLLELSNNLKQDLSSIEDSQNKINSNKVAIERLNDKIVSMEEQFEKNEIIRINLKEDIKKLVNKIENLEHCIQDKEEEKNKYSIINTKNEIERENLYTKLNEELNLTYAEAVEKAKPVDNIEKFKKEILSIKSSISELGNVNLGAIEEYEEVKNKFSFMSVQKEDLMKAREELLALISEMTEKMKIVFNENFLILKKNFNETFRELFKGGSADLILCDGDELSANIEINVEPPGKKLQNINLMSGGEKVLSAIALLFAILKMKPTPFCILDEIEAALDDANVYRYAEFLKQFSSNIQFIVITHRKGTMEASDVLYGVTMEEKGISKIVSVDLSNQ